MNKKCAIFNYWWSWQDAHGASLTALALYKLIEELGYEPCLATTVFKGMSVEQCMNGRHARFIEKYARHTEKNYQTGEEYEELNDEFEHFIVGSDQVLRVEWVPDEWFLYPIADNKNKIIMSGSFGGNSLKASEQRIQRVAECLKSFSAVSVREQDGIDTYTRYFGARCDLEWVMDPVFLINPKFYYSLMKQRSKYQSSAFEPESIFLYILDMTPEKEALKEKLAQKYSVTVLEDDEELMAEDFLYIVANCKMVITDSFHGACFSIILNRPFYCIYNEMRGASRTSTLKDIFDLGNIMLEEGHIGQFEFDVPFIDYTQINKRIEREQNRGRAWLLQALERRK